MQIYKSFKVTYVRLETDHGSFRVWSDDKIDLWDNSIMDWIFFDDGDNILIAQQLRAAARRERGE